MVITKEKYQAAKALVPAHEVSDRFKIPELRREIEANIDPEDPDPENGYLFR